MKKFKWSAKKVWIERISRRSKASRDGSDGEEYAVLKVSLGAPYAYVDTLKKGQAYRQIVTLMCFRPEVYERLEVDDYFQLEGTISFKPGFTWLVVEKAYDDLEFDVEKEASVYYCNYTPPPVSPPVVRLVQ